MRGRRVFAGVLRAHLRAMPHHLFMVHAAMLRRIMLSGIVTALPLMLLHHLAVPHHFFMAHRLMTHPLGRRATAESRRR